LASVGSRRWYLLPINFDLSRGDPRIVELHFGFLVSEGTPSDDLVLEFMEFRNNTLPTTDAFPPVKQKIWDRLLIEKDLADITDICRRPHQ